ncbi:hypothetical protein H5410_031820 [Solanum commersonii]|uniref:Uncharacterized protein n=1 Tax=Solanum commersonii TaxID=4109 RepID=A0A9J5YJB7_SOLCO|nr:hypothetical protein H5410_031820 [Solanum commersonii]
MEKRTVATTHNKTTEAKETISNNKIEEQYSINDYELCQQTQGANIGVPLVLCMPKDGCFFMHIRTIIVAGNNLWAIGMS